MGLVVRIRGVARSFPSVVWREDSDLVALETWIADGERTKERRL